MSKQYTIDRTLEFNTQTGYWSLTVEVTSASEVSPYPFLLEKAIPGTTGADTLSSSQEEPQYLRTLLESEIATTRLESSEEVYDKFTWVQYVSNKFTKTYYTYSAATKALTSVLSILKSNAKVYTTPKDKPILVVTNLSVNPNKPLLEKVELSKGDTISVQLVGGAGQANVISDAEFITVSKAADSSNRRKSNNFVITIVDTTNASFIGIEDFWTSTRYTIPLVPLATPLEGITTEVIK